MVGGQETGRDAAHLDELYRMAVAGGTFADPERAAARYADYREEVRARG
jgi:hypothetical protein